MIFEQIATGGCQSYLLGCPDTFAAVLIDPAQQDQTSLARLFRAAAFVAGAPCRAMVNLLFCASGAQCLLLSPGDHPDPFFWDLAAHAGAGFSELFGAPTARGHAAGHNPYRIDPERFLAMLPK